MSDKNFWFGYLQAGDKSSLVVQDARVNTGNKLTVYLYNQLRGELVEYRRDIIESKLREAEPGEYDANELGKAYLEALKRAKPNAYQILFAPETRAPSKKTAEVAPKVNDDDEGEDIDIDIDEDLDVEDDVFAEEDSED